MTDTTSPAQPGPEIPYVELFREVRFNAHPISGELTSWSVTPCAKDNDSPWAAVDIPVQHAGVLYGVTCYIVGVEAFTPALAEMAFLGEYRDELLMLTEADDEF